MNLKTLEHHLDTLKRVDLAKLRTEAIYWAKVCQDNSARPDGYPRQHIGAEPSSGRTPDKDPSEADLNPVEEAATAVKRLDQIDMKTAVALGNIATAARALEVAVAKFTEARNLQARIDGTPKAECFVMRQRADVFEEAAHKTDFKTVLDVPLDEPRWVSAWVYKFTRENRVLPTREQCRAHARGDRVMMTLA